MSLQCYCIRPFATLLRLLRTPFPPPSGPTPLFRICIRTLIPSFVPWLLRYLCTVERCICFIHAFRGIGAVRHELILGHIHSFFFCYFLALLIAMSYHCYVLALRSFYVLVPPCFFVAIFSSPYPSIIQSYYLFHRHKPLSIRNVTYPFIALFCDRDINRKQCLRARMRRPLLRLELGLRRLT